MAESTVAYVKQPRIPAEKHCRVCRELKPAGDYYSYKYVTNQGKLSVRLDPDCKSCTAAARSQAEAREKENGRNRKRRREHPEIMKAYLARKRAEPKPPIAEKMCAKCNEVKPAAKFYRRLKNTDGLHSQCRACVLAVSDAYHRTIEPHRVASWKQESHLKHRYGMTLNEYEWLASAQDNKCLICGQSEILLDVDHCHKTGRIRGLLCHMCNLGLGNLKEDVRIVTGMLRYIEERCCH